MKQQTTISNAEVTVLFLEGPSSFVDNYESKFRTSTAEGS